MHVLITIDPLGWGCECQWVSASGLHHGHREFLQGCFADVHDEFRDHRGSQMENATNHAPVAKPAASRIANIWLCVASYRRTTTVVGECCDGRLVPDPVNPSVPACHVEVQASGQGSGIRQEWRNRQTWLQWSSGQHAFPWSNPKWTKTDGRLPRWSNSLSCEMPSWRHQRSQRTRCWRGERFPPPSPSCFEPRTCGEREGIPWSAGSHRRTCRTKNVHPTVTEEPFAKWCWNWL